MPFEQLPLNSDNIFVPLAERMRPKSLSDYAGQQHLLGADKPLNLSIKNQQCHSMIFWGAPGTGKTTLARMFADAFEAEWLSLSAVLSGVKEIRSVIDKATLLANSGKKTILFVDEVHRFNKSQQDAFLPFIEDGTLIFIGATTENPSFALNNALLSRARVYVLKPLNEADLIQILHHALNRDETLKNTQINTNYLKIIAKVADGDARRALSFLEIVNDLADETNGQKIITKSMVLSVVGDTQRRFDNHGEDFYNQISALHKSIRGSNPDASLYWLCRMLDAGIEPLYLSRRLIRIASEDIGNADPRALEVANNAALAYERLGSPEGELALAQCTIYLAVAAKSNSVYLSFKQIMAEIKNSGSLEVPLHLRNASTKLMADLNYGKTYRYAHDEPNAYAAGEQYLPKELIGKTYYQPSDRGLEKKIIKRMQFFKSLDNRH